MHYPEIPKPFVDAWLDYCYYYGASPAEQKARYGVAFARGNVSLKQGHSRLTAYAAQKRGNSTLAARAWSEFMNAATTDELSPTAPWATVKVGGSDVLTEVEEATWITTNAAALYGLSGIELLALIGGPK